jgi:hypothetical protein
VTASQSEFLKPSIDSKYLLFTSSSRLLNSLVRMSAKQRLEGLRTACGGRSSCFSNRRSSAVFEQKAAAVRSPIAHTPINQVSSTQRNNLPMAQQARALRAGFAGATNARHRRGNSDIDDGWASLDTLNLEQARRAVSRVATDDESRIIPRSRVSTHRCRFLPRIVQKP